MLTFEAQRWFKCVGIEAALATGITLLAALPDPNFQLSTSNTIAVKQILCPIVGACRTAELLAMKLGLRPDDKTRGPAAMLQARGHAAYLSLDNIFAPCTPLVAHVIGTIWVTAWARHGPGGV